MSKLDVVSLITRKRNGESLTGEEIRSLIQAYTAGTVGQHQMAAWLMAVFFRGMDARETLALTRAMVESGVRLDLKGLGKPRVDKHSTGGVGDKTSLVLAPLVAAAGAAVPMISGRSLGFTGGTLDKLESIPGFRVNLSIREFQTVLEKTGCAIIGQTEKLAPADRGIYALRDATATIECVPLIVASILSKKLVEDLDALVLDVKVGEGSFMSSLEAASDLAQNLVEVANSFGTKTVAFLTDMSQPLGSAVGNALEVREAIETLQGKGPPDFRQLCEKLAVRMVLLSSPGEELPRVREKIARLLESGKALERFREMVAAQGGDPRTVDDVDRLPRAINQKTVCAPRSGWVMAVKARQIGSASLALGAGRRDLDDRIDFSVGILVHKRTGDAVEAGEPVCTVHYNREEQWALVQGTLQAAFHIGEKRVESPPLIKRMVEG
jgi:pyrimidine-nucleoside phosphorylase